LAKLSEDGVMSSWHKRNPGECPLFHGGASLT
jgi:hypothetical protein